MNLDTIEALSQQSTEILKTILILAEQNDDNIKIDNTNGVFIPLCVEVIYREQNLLQLSICHYGKLNGDLMADPEMCFIYKDNKFYPFYYKNDYFGMEQESLDVHGIEVEEIDSRLYDEHLKFANSWLNTIQQQQKIISTNQL